MQVIVTLKALKQLEKLPPSTQARIKLKLLFLGKNPFEGKQLMGNLAGVRSLRVWPYRVLYYIEPEAKKLFVVTIAYRQGVYT